MPMSTQGGNNIYTMYIRMRSPVKARNKQRVTSAGGTESHGFARKVVWTCAQRRQDAVHCEQPHEQSKIPHKAVWSTLDGTRPKQWILKRRKREPMSLTEVGGHTGLKKPTLQKNHRLQEECVRHDGDIGDLSEMRTGQVRCKNEQHARIIFKSREGRVVKNLMWIK